MVSIHVWQNDDCLELKLPQLPDNYTVTVHVRPHLLTKDYVTGIIQTIVNNTKLPTIHIVVISNKDTICRQYRDVVRYLTLINEVNGLQPHTLLICVSLIAGYSVNVRNAKRLLTRMLLPEPKVVLADLGADLRFDDFSSKSRVIPEASRWIGRKIIRLIVRSVPKLIRK
jgi:hypothetical protein